MSWLYTIGRVFGIRTVSFSDADHYHHSSNSNAVLSYLLQNAPPGKAAWENANRVVVGIIVSDASGRVFGVRKESFSFCSSPHLIFVPLIIHFVLPPPNVLFRTPPPPLMLLLIVIPFYRTSTPSSAVSR